MWGEIQSTFKSCVEQSQTDSHHVDVVDPSNFLALDHAPKSADRRVEYKNVADIQGAIMLLRKLHQLPGMCGIQGERFLHKHV